MKKEFFEKIKSRAIGDYVFKDGQFGEDGPTSKDVGYVLAVEVNDNEMESRAETFYRVYFENYPGYYIGFDYTGTYTPFQGELDIGT